MKQKLTILMFGLLLAVGWTVDAQAQLKRNAAVQSQQAIAVPHEHEQEHAVTVDGKLWQGRSVSNRAPRRGHTDVTANEVNYTQSDYYGITYNWYNGTTATGTPTVAHLTEEVTNPYQMYWMLRSAYIDTSVPGIRYNDVFQEPTIYFGLQRGWNIGTLQPVTITLSDGYACIRAIEILDTLGNTVTSWTAGSSSANLPSTWQASGTLRSTTVGSSSNTYYYMTGGGTITIPASALSSSQTEDFRIKITAGSDRSSTSATVSTITYTSGIYGNSTIELTNGTGYIYTRFLARNWGTIDPPEKNAYTVFLVKLKDFTEVSQNEGWAERTHQSTAQELINVFDKYFASIELLTDGLRVGENDTTSGTVFAYTGVLNRFYFIGKGKTASYDSEGSGFSAINFGPFYTMYEEFSPTTTDSGVETADFYNKMRVDGEYYSVKHDCATVLGYQHYFSMYGKDTTVYKSVAPLVLYIPDLRSKDGSRNYEEGHKPQVGLYTIDLAAETEPSDTYAQDSTYTVYLDWTSSLNKMVNNTVDQTYIIYTVEFDSLGNRVYHTLDTVYDVTTYQYNVPQTMASQQITYVIMGYPTDANNNPENQRGGIFYVYSNPDDVQIPGLFDFMVLYRQRYESDFYVQKQQNYYRNYLYPSNLAPGTGMTLGQLKNEWPNQTASYTLWRDDQGIAKLEVRAIRDKVYYRIQYYENTQDTDWRNDIEMPYPYVEIPNENN